MLSPLLGVSSKWSIRVGVVLLSITLLDELANIGQGNLSDVCS